MNRPTRASLVFASLGLTVACIPAVYAQEKVYRCPGNLYTDALTAKEASDRGCKTLEGSPITVIQSSPPRVAPKAVSSGSVASPGERISLDDQKTRDADSRRILEAELRKEEDALAILRKEFNNGEPDRRGDERNFQKYQDRLADMRNALIRKEADVTSIRRELNKLSASSVPSGSSAR